MSPDSSGDTPSGSTPHHVQSPAARDDPLMTALDDWLTVLDKAIAGELSAEQRTQLADGAAELRQIMSEMRAHRKQQSRV